MQSAVLDLPIGSIGWILGPPVNVYNIFNTVIGLSHLCCTVLPKQSFCSFPYTVALHFRILQNFKHPSSSLPLLKLIKHISMFLQSWRWGIGRGLTSGLFSGLSLSKSSTGNQCLSPLMLWVRILIRERCTKFVSYLLQVGGFLRVLRFFPSIKLTATI